jgi:TonB dependent receptor/Carboxypeptidase regulatory-like domain/TonB-dependent Receptor Plug Domain
MVALIHRLVAVGCFLFAALAYAAPGAAQTPAVSVSGVVTDAGGAPLAGVVVIARGPATATATTGADGKFALAGLAPGLYTVTASKAGYSAASQTDVAVVTGAPQALNISLAAATLSSLREIGRTSVNAGRTGAFNASPASVATISSQTFVDQSQPQVAHILNQTPGIVSSLPGGVNNASPGAITFPDIRGALSFETAALIDGHPLSVGQYGDYVTTFLNSFSLQSVELIKGPGASSPTISRAIGGTVNFRTLDPTLRPHGTLTVGTDSFGGVFSNFGYSNTVGKLGFVVDYSVDGTPGPLHNAKYQMPLDSGVYYIQDSHGALISLPNGTVSPAFPPGQYNTRSEATSSLIFCCETESTTYTNKNELVKLRYNLSSTTTITGSYLGSQTYADQNGNNGNRTTTMFAPGAGYAGSVAPGVQTIIDPDNLGLPAYEMNNEPIFQAELRSSFHQDTILARYYAASISRLQYGSNHNPNASSSFNALVYGGGNGNPVFNGLDQYGKPYTVTVPGPNDPVMSGGSNYYDSAEEDRLAGTSFEYDHFLGDTGNVVSLSYDTNHARTHSYSLGSSLDSVPAGSTQDTTTYLLRGIFTFGKLNVTASNYLTEFRSHYGIYLNAFTSNQSLAFQDQDLWHYDGRLGLVLRPTPDASVRFSLGSAVAPPYLGALVADTFAPQLCGGFFTPCPTPATPNVAVSQVANPGLQAETSFGYDLGADLRLKDRVTVLTADVYMTNLHNQLVKSTYINGTATVDTGGGVMATLPLYTTAYTNVSNARYAGVEFGIHADRPIGFGYTLQGALLRAYPYNLSPSFFTGSGGPNTVNIGVVPNINFGSHQTVSNQAIPYSQGYGEIRYVTPGKVFLSFGETYYGPNNSLGDPPFLVANATIRVPLGKSSGTTLQVSADNLFSVYSDPIPTEYVGFRQPLINGQYYAGNANVIGPRNVRVSITHTFGSR